MNPETLIIDPSTHKIKNDSSGNPPILPPNTKLDGDVNAQSHAITALDAIAMSSAARGRIGGTKEVWIKDREVSTGGDGLGGTGFEHDPFNAGTQAKFDTLMSSIPAGATIRLAPSTTFLTNSFIFKEGWRMHGKGTTIKLASGVATTGSPAISVINTGGAFRNYIELVDITIDCNRANQPAYTANTSLGKLDALNVGAKSAKLFRVRGLGCWNNDGPSHTREGFPFKVEHDGSTDADDFISLKECEVLLTEGYQTAICFFDQLGGTIAGEIIDCYVTGGAVSTPNPVQGFGAGGGLHVKMRGNRTKNVGNGMIFDTGDFHDYDISECTLDCLLNGIAFNGGLSQYDDFRIRHNWIKIPAGGQNCLQGGNSVAGTFVSIDSNTLINASSNPAFSLAGNGFLHRNSVTEATRSVIGTHIPAAYIVPPTNVDTSGVPLYTGNLIKVKTADSSLSSQTTPQADSELQIPLTPGLWRVQLIAFFDFGANSANVVGQLYFSGTITAVRESFHAPTGQNYETTDINGTATQVGLDSGNMGHQEIQALLTVSTSGTLSYKWAQLASSASVHKLQKYSTLKAELVR